MAEGGKWKDRQGGWLWLGRFLLAWWPGAISLSYYNAERDLCLWCKTLRRAFTDKQREGWLR